MTRARESTSSTGEPVIPVDSLEGMRILIPWARAGRFVLNGYHRALAEKHGVPVDGVMFSEPLPC